MQDEYTNYDFVRKKYKPLDGIPKEEYFKNFCVGAIYSLFTRFFFLYSSPRL